MPPPVGAGKMQPGRNVAPKAPVQQDEPAMKATNDPAYQTLAGYQKQTHLNFRF